MTTEAQTLSKALESQLAGANPSMMEKSIQWIRNNCIPDEGITITSRQRTSYPEVTGYYIPTLLSIGEHEKAEAFANWLTTIQKKDGSFGGGGDNASYVFDTGQVIRGWASILKVKPELEKNLRAACDWVIATADPNTGRLLTPPPGHSWSLGARGELNEAVHLYVLSPMRRVGELLDDPKYLQFVNKSLDYYLKNTNITDFTQSNALSHFYAYIQEALMELGCESEAKLGMASAARSQQPSGAVPAHSDINWICSTGLAQLAQVWYMLGETDRADAAMSFLEQIQNPSGGFFGSYGVGAEYFPSEEISWATKYIVDACQKQILSLFDKTVQIYDSNIDMSDGRVQAVINKLGNLNGKRVLDAGCGKGRYSTILKRLYPTAEITAMDISSEMLKHIPIGIKKTQAGILAMPFEDNSFDAVICIEALEHVVQIEEGIRQLARVTAPGGMVLVIDKNVDMLGALQMPSWEKWFSRTALMDEMTKAGLDADSEFITHSSNSNLDGLFICWSGQKKRQGGNLNAEHWHSAITGGASVSTIEQSVRSGIEKPWMSVIHQITSPGQRVLELGSGTGELSSQLALQGRECTLLDFSRESLDFSSQLFKNLGIEGRYVECDVLGRLPFEDNAFDCVWSSGLLEHFSEDQIQHILSEARRVCNGAVVSLVPNAKSIPYRIGKYIQERAKTWPWGEENPKTSLKPIYEKAGFEDIAEFTVAPKHAIEFLKAPGFEPVCAALEQWYGSIDASELETLDQGYLLVSIGRVTKSCHLAVAPNDSLNDNVRAGLPDLTAYAPKTGGLKISKIKTNKRMKIAYYGNCWMTNLGEAFIDMGAMELLKQAMPESDVIFVTPMSRYYNNAMRIQSHNTTTSQEQSYRNAAHMGRYINADMFVLSGMFATEEFVYTDGTYWVDEFLQTHPEMKVLFMGIGGQQYSERETAVFLNFIKQKVNLAGFISRDNETYKSYKDLLPNCQPGIDCAFFVSDVYKPVGFASKDYVISTFHNMPEAGFVKSLNCDVIRPEHMFYEAKYDETIENFFISDSPHDYLSLYANAKEVHTDLVHATIVSLAYGTKVKYYHDSKRSFAFEAVGAIKDNDGYLVLPRETLQAKKQAFIEAVRKSLLS